MRFPNSQGNIWELCSNLEFLSFFCPLTQTTLLLLTFISLDFHYFACIQQNSISSTWHLFESCISNLIISRNWDVEWHSVLPSPFSLFFLKTFLRTEFFWLVSLTMISSLQGYHCHVLLGNPQHEQLRSHWLIPHLHLHPPPVLPHFLDCCCLPPLSSALQCCLLYYRSIHLSTFWHYLHVHWRISWHARQKEGMWDCLLESPSLPACWTLCRLVISWRGLKWVEVNSTWTHSHSWVLTGRLCSKTWSIVSLLGIFIRQTTLNTHPPCLLLLNGSGWLSSEAKTLFASFVAVIAKNLGIFEE